MPPILNRVPLRESEEHVDVAGVPVVLRANQPVVWVTLWPWSGAGDPGWVPFPAVLDTGNNDSFTIPAALFTAWTGLDYSRLPASQTRLVNNAIRAGLYRYNVRLHRLGPDGRPTPPVAFTLQTDTGVTVLPHAGGAFPRLPTVGVRCLRVNRLHFFLNGHRRYFSLRTYR